MPGLEMGLEGTTDREEGEGGGESCGMNEQGGSGGAGPQRPALPAKYAMPKRARMPSATLELVVGGIELQEARENGGQIRELAKKEVVLEAQGEEAGEIGEGIARDRPIEVIDREVKAEEAREVADGRQDLAGEVILGEVHELEVGEGGEEGAIEVIAMEVEDAELVQVGERVERIMEVKEGNDERRQPPVGALHATPMASASIGSAPIGGQVAVGVGPRSEDG